MWYTPARAALRDAVKHRGNGGSPAPSSGAFLVAYLTGAAVRGRGVGAENTF